MDAPGTFYCSKLVHGFVLKFDILYSKWFSLNFFFQIIIKKVASEHQHIDLITLILKIGSFLNSVIKILWISVYSISDTGFLVCIYRTEKLRMRQAVRTWGTLGQTSCCGIGLWNWVRHYQGYVPLTPRREWQYPNFSILLCTSVMRFWRKTAECW